MKKLYVDCLSEYYRAALMENGTLTELIYQEKADDISVGDIYIGRIDKVLPSGIAFVDIGRDKPVFLQADELKSGRDVIVQIIKEAYNEKCAVATKKISITGKCCVVIANDSGVGVSKKIEDLALKNDLKILGERYAEDNIGIILRTNCDNAKLSDIEDELANSKAELKALLEKGQYIKSPYTLKKETNIILKTIRDIITNDCDSVVINDNEDIGYDAEIYDGTSPMFNYYGIESEIEKLFHKKIWLKSGGYIVIDETEAMTVIDVNSGKAIGEKNFIRVNEEAAKEAARQIRLRNLSGMIIIDFINVNNGNDVIMQTLEKCLAMDRIKTYIVGMTSLGLMQLTRQKKRKPLSKYITHICPVCGGVGYVKSADYMAEKIVNEIADIFSSTIYNSVEVSSSSAIIRALKNNTCKIEQKFGGKIILNVIPTTKFDYYEISKSRI